MSNIEYPFTGCRVLDLTDEKGLLCGKLFADLGATVIKIEPPGGSLSRRTGPFFKDIPHPEKSLYWFALNRGKKSITLNIETIDGREIFKQLIIKTDVIVESFSPGYMKVLGLDYNSIAHLNHRLVYTSISHYGQDGPYRNFKGCDLVAMALSGYLNLCGDSDRPPVRISLPQAYFHSGAEAAAATAMAYYHSLMTGEGQHADISVQESLIWLLMQAQMYWNVQQINPPRVGQCWVTAATGVRSTLNWECRDGYITYLLMGGAEARRARNLVTWMKEEGMASDFLEQLDWEKVFDISVVSQENINRITEPIAKFFKTHTKSELLEEAIRRDIQLFPVFTTTDMLNDMQLKTRDYWDTVKHDELDAILTYPGPFIKFNKTPIKKTGRAPLIGEHNEEIYIKELGLSHQTVTAYKETGVI